MEITTYWHRTAVGRLNECDADRIDSLISKLHLTGRIVNIVFRDGREPTLYQLEESVCAYEVKGEVYQLMSFLGGYYLYPISQTNRDYIHDILTVKKKAWLHHDSDCAGNHNEEHDGH